MNPSIPHTILIVDDNPTNLSVLSDYLKGYGFEIIVARSGESALKRVQYVVPDLVLMDVMMPGIDGFETCRRLKQVEDVGEAPVIFMTALTSTEDKVKGFQVGAVDYVTKPLQHEEVLARVTTHLRLRDLARELQRANLELEKHAGYLKRRTVQLQAAAEVARDATAARQLDDLLKRAVNLIRDRFGFYHAGIFLVDERREYAVLRAANGEVGRQMLEAGHKLKVGVEGIVGYVAASGRARIALDVENDPFHYKNPLLPETASEMALPLKVDDRIIGCLDVQSPETAAFSGDDVQVLQTMADQLAVAYEKMRLFSQIQASLETRLQTVVSNAPVALFALNCDGIFTLAEGKALDILGYDPDTLLGRSAFDLWSRQPALIHGLRGSLQGEPFEATLEAGRLVFEVRGAPQRDLEQQVVGVILLATDVTERRQREREQQAIVTVAAAMRGALALGDMLPIILDQLLALLNARGAILARRDPLKGNLVIELGRGEWNRLTGTRLGAQAGILSLVITTGQRYVSSSSGAGLGPQDAEYFGALSAVACVPLITNDQVLGALCVGSPIPFQPSEVNIFTAVADFVANAIQRAILNAQTEQRLRRLVALRAIDASITGSLDLQVTLEVLLEQVANQLHVDAASLLLLNPATRQLSFIAGRGFDPTELQQLPMSLGAGYVGRAALERRSLMGLDPAHMEDSPRAALLADDGFVIYFCVPLVARGQLKGVLEVFHRKPLDPDSEWLDFLETLAGQAAIAVDNALLFDHLQQANAELLKAYDSTLAGWALALELRDRETEGHCQRVTDLTLDLARAMGVNETELVHIRQGALLHDIGKMGIPDEILLKPGPLNEQEWVIMRRHPLYAYNMLAAIPYLRPALDIPRFHHEKWDGSGYPYGLKGEQIPLAARIFAIVDVWDALCSDRPYRLAVPRDQALEYLHQQAGKHFDPQVVSTFLHLLNLGEAEA